TGEVTRAPSPCPTEMKSTRRVGSAATASPRGNRAAPRSTQATKNARRVRENIRLARQGMPAPYGRQHDQYKKVGSPHAGASDAAQRGGVTGPRHPWYREGDAPARSPGRRPSGRCRGPGGRDAGAARLVL